MASPEIAEQPMRGWWHDRGVIIGVIGVIATIVVGGATYWLTAGGVSREYDERVRTARSDILVELGRSIGEDVVPDREKITAVIDSVDREYGIKPQDSEQVDTVIDDLIARVLANEFLDSKRRQELSSQLLAVKNTPPPAPTGLQVVSFTGSKNSIPQRFAILMGLLTGISTAIIGLLFFRAPWPLFAIAVVVLGMLLFLVALFVSPTGRGLLGWFLRQ
jgi:hypothetical protein